MTSVLWLSERLWRKSLRAGYGNRVDGGYFTSRSWLSVWYWLRIFPGYRVLAGYEFKRRGFGYRFHVGYEQGNRMNFGYKLSIDDSQAIVVHWATNFIRRTLGYRPEPWLQTSIGPFMAIVSTLAKN